MTKVKGDRRLLPKFKTHACNSINFSEQESVRSHIKIEFIVSLKKKVPYLIRG